MNNPTKDEVREAVDFKTCSRCGQTKPARLFRKFRYCCKSCKAQPKLSADSVMIQRLFKHAFPEPNSGCWLWDSALRLDGYPIIYDGVRLVSATRVCVRLIKKESVEGLFVRHTCDTPQCVNPDHLIVGTHQDNMNDRAKRGRVHRWRGLRKDGMPVILDADKVKAIRRSTKTAGALAREYGVSSITIRRVRSFQTWKTV